MRIITAQGPVEALLTSVNLCLHDESDIVSVEIGLIFGDERAADAAAGTRPWRVLFDRGSVSDGETMLREAVKSGRVLTLEEAVARKMMDEGEEDGTIEIKSVTVKPPREIVQLHRTRAAMFHLGNDCEAEAVGWFPARMGATNGNGR